MSSKHFSVFLFITLLLNSSDAFSSPRNAQDEFAYALLHARSAWDIGYGDKPREIFRALPQDEKNKFLPYVCSALKSEDKEVRENGIHACSYIGPMATSCLSDALEMKYIELTDLSWNLPKMGMLTPVIEKAIVEFIHSPESDRRVGLLETFGECRYSSKDVATALKEKLAHFKDKQRLPYLICGLTKLGEVETVRPIIKKLIREGDRQSLYCISGNDIKANIFAKDIANSTKITLEEKIQVLMTIEAERDVLLPLIMQGIKSEGAARVVAANAVVKFGFLNNELLSNACTWAKLVNRYDYKPFLSFSSFNSVNAKKLFAALNKCEVPVTGWNNRDWIDAALLEMVPNLKDEIYVLLNSDSVHCPAVIKAVALSGPRAAKPLVEIMRQAAGVGGQREEIARTIASMGPDAAPAIPELSELFTCSDSNIYIPAAWILGAIGSESLPVLHRMEGNSLYADRLIAAISFMPPSPEAFAMLSRLVASTKDVEILKQSANVLKTWNSYPDRSAVLLLQMSDNPDSELSSLSLDTLSGFGRDARNVVPSLRKRLIRALTAKDYQKAYFIALALSRVDEPSVQINDLLVTIYANTDRIMAPLPSDSLSKISRLSRKALLAQIDDVKASPEPLSYFARVNPCFQRVLQVFRLLIRSDLLSRAELEVYTDSENSCYSIAALKALCEMPTTEALASCLKNIERLSEINSTGMRELAALACDIGTPEAKKTCQKVLASPRFPHIR